MKQIFIERRENIIRIAIKSNGKLEECFVEEENREPQPGEIYKGIVKNIVPAIKCAFVDIGYDKNCYMYMDKKFNNAYVKKNDEVVVEVLKEAVDDKGPKVTNAFTLAGRYVVLENLKKGISFSSKILNKEFKQQVKENIRLPEGLGVVVRTNAEQAPMDLLNREIEKLHRDYESIMQEARYSIKPRLLYGGEGILSKVLRDILDKNTELIVVDNEKDYELIKEYLEFAVDVESKLELHNESRTLFNYFNIEKEILSLRHNRVALKSGGNIVIDKTEGMTVIDVNSAKNNKSSSIKETAFNTNMEAAAEIGRQIKLRNLGGIIVVDFIDMESYELKNKILKNLRSFFENDKNKTIIYPFTELNLVQIARRRRGKPILEFIEESCSACEGKGSKVSLAYLNTLIQNEIMEIDSELKVENIYIEIADMYKEAIMENIDGFAEKIGGINKILYVNFTHGKEIFKVEPLIFKNHIEKLQKYKIYG